MLDQLSTYSTIFIIGCAILHILMFIVVRIWAGRDMYAMADLLDDFTRPLKHRSLLDKREYLADQVEAFLSDVKEVLETPERAIERTELSRRMHILDEKRKYLSSMRFVTLYNMCRTMIEAYPLAGVMGTILAIGAALQLRSVNADNTSVNVIVERFGDAIWSTFAGLLIAISLMFLNSLLEPSIERIAELKSQIRELVARVKRELPLVNHGPVSPPQNQMPGGDA